MLALVAIVAMAATARAVPVRRPGVVLSGGGNVGNALIGQARERIAAQANNDAHPTTATALPDMGPPKSDVQLGLYRVRKWNDGTIQYDVAAGHTFNELSHYIPKVETKLPGIVTRRVRPDESQVHVWSDGAVYVGSDPREIILNKVDEELRDADNAAHGAQFYSEAYASDKQSSQISTTTAKVIGYGGPLVIAAMIADLSAASDGAEAQKDAAEANQHIHNANDLLGQFR